MGVAEVGEVVIGTEEVGEEVMGEVEEGPIDGADVRLVGVVVGDVLRTLVGALLGFTVDIVLGTLEAKVVENGNRVNLLVILIFPNPKPHIPTRDTTVDVRGMFNVAVNDEVDMP